MRGVNAPHGGSRVSFRWCATPAVATDIAGHRDAVVDNETGLLVRDEATLGATLAKVLLDDELRKRLGEGARHRAKSLTWARTAASLFALLDGGSSRAPGG